VWVNRRGLSELKKEFATSFSLGGSFPISTMTNLKFQVQQRDIITSNERARSSEYGSHDGKGLE
jgi:hypothetical protein